MTEYHPLPRNKRMKWLLSDGRIAEEPALEQSAEGRRVRVMGSTKSVYKKDLEDLVYRSVQAFAQKNGTRAWMRAVDDPVKELHEYSTPVDASDPHFLQPSNKAYYRRSSEVSWTFRHETLPIAAKLTIKAVEEHRSDRKQVVTAAITYPSTNPADAYERVWLDAQNPREFTFSKHDEGTTDFAQAKQRFFDSLRDYVPDWAKEILGRHEYSNEREAAAGVAKLCKRIESFEGISIPDLRNPDEPDWIELGLYETTYSPEYLRAIIDFINGQPIAERLAELWQEMVETFQSAGVVVGKLKESDFAAAIQGETERVDVSASHPFDEDGASVDQQHYVGFNLLTGTITVSCKIRDTNPAEIATEYEIARIKAEARGELDAFLNYQANALNRKHDQRHRKTVEKRTVDVPDELDELLAASN